MSSKLYPKDILGTIFTENPFIAEIALESEFSDSAKCVLFISQVLTKYNVYPLVFNMTSTDAKQYTVFFIDYSSIKGSLEGLVSELKGNPNILNVKFRVKRIREKILDMFAKPTFGQGKYVALVLGVDEFSWVYEKIKETYGSGGEAFLYHIGYSFGEIAGEKYMGKEITEDFIREDLLAFQAYGWGIPEILEIDLVEYGVVIRFYDLFESIHAKGKKNRPNCHFVRGHLAGLFSKFFNRKMFAIETKCIAKGDPYCEFVVKPIT